MKKINKKFQKELQALKVASQGGFKKNYQYFGDAIYRRISQLEIEHHFKNAL